MCFTTSANATYQHIKWQIRNHTHLLCIKLTRKQHMVLLTKLDKQINMADVTKLKIYVNSNDCFEARNLNIFTNFTLTFFSADPISKWLNKCDLSFYQNELNFAVWCASSGCGVSVEHFTSTHSSYYHLYSDFICNIRSGRYWKK
jgi:hypothetical protein